MKQVFSFLLIILSISNGFGSNPCLNQNPQIYDSNGDPVNDPNYSGPIEIKDPGIYTGSWSSQDPDIPVVKISTTECVIIENSCLVGPGHIIAGGNRTGINITVRNCDITGLDPINYPYNNNGKILELNVPSYVYFHNNEVTGTRGIEIWRQNGASQPNQTPVYRIYNNKILNLDGRKYDSSGNLIKSYSGQPGYQADGLGNMCPHSLTGSYTTKCYAYDWRWAFFVRIADITTIDCEITWNEVINKPNQSAVEDVINLYNCGGTEENPIIVKNNFLWGAYPYGDQNADAYSNHFYTGGGINAGDGCSNEPENRNKHIEIEDNQVIGTTRYGIGILSGNNITVRNNRVIASGLGPDNQNGFNNIIWAQSRPLPLIFRSRGIHIETYQGPMFPCGNTEINNLTNPWAAIQYGGVTWREDPTILQNLVVDNLIWWKRGSYIAGDPAGTGNPNPLSIINFPDPNSNPGVLRGAPGTFDGPPNTTDGFYSVSPWKYKDPNNIPDPNDPLDWRWDKETQILGEIPANTNRSGGGGSGGNPTIVINEFKTDPITYQHEEGEYDNWVAKYNQANQTIGKLSEWECESEPQERTGFLEDKTKPSISPNPNNGGFTLDLKNSKVKSIVFYNANGLIWKTIDTIDSNWITINSLPKGFWFVRIQGEGFDHTEKIIVQ